VIVACVCIALWVVPAYQEWTHSRDVSDVWRRAVELQLRVREVQSIVRASGQRWMRSDRAALDDLARNRAALVSQLADLVTQTNRMCSDDCRRHLSRTAAVLWAIDIYDDLSEHEKFERDRRGTFTVVPLDGNEHTAALEARGGRAGAVGLGKQRRVADSVRVSPPAAEGTKITGITGAMGPTVDGVDAPHRRRGEKLQGADSGVSCVLTGRGR
jgi:hypothetical protein